MGIFSAEGFEKGYEQGLAASKAEAIKSFTIEELVAEIEARAYERGKADERKIVKQELRDLLDKPNVGRILWPEAVVDIVYDWLEEQKDET